VGGRNLPDPDLAHTSFLLGADGEYRIVRRDGAEERTLGEGTTGPAPGTARTLAVRVEGEQVRFLVDGQPVETLPREEVEPHGTVGIRLDEGAQVEIREWTLSLPDDASASGSPS
jgi:hypothetical protein